MVQELLKKPGVTEDRKTTPLPTLQLPPLVSARQGEGSENVESAQTTRHMQMQHSAQCDEQFDEGVQGQKVWGMLCVHNYWCRLHLCAL
jgi:hypothetical protein